MKGPTHDAIGMATAVVVADRLRLGPGGMVLMGVPAYLSGSLPDQLERVPFLRRRVRHRRETHSVLAWLLVASIAFLVPMLGAPALGLPLLGVFVSYVAHALADTPTLGGAEILWPVSQFFPERFRIVHSLPGPFRFRVSDLTVTDPGGRTTISRRALVEPMVRPLVLLGLVLYLAL